MLGCDNINGRKYYLNELSSGDTEIVVMTGSGLARCWLGRGPANLKIPIYTLKVRILAELSKY